MLRAVQNTSASPLAALAVKSAANRRFTAAHAMASYSSGAALDWLGRFTNYEQQGVPQAAGTNSDSGFDLGRMHRLLGDLGDPHHDWPVAAHVAGTKGKGSTVALLSSILLAAGYKAGAYTSPHIQSFNERIAVGGSPISAAALDALVAAHGDTVEAAHSREAGALSHFEIVTALAFKHFQEQQVDAAVIEVGLGGARDATNVLPSASLAAAVITAVGQDHAAALGGSVQAIAAAKAGIMQAGRPVVVARQPEPAAEAVLLQRAEELGCPVIEALKEVQFHSAAADESSSSGAAGPAMLQQRLRMVVTGQTAAAFEASVEQIEQEVRIRLLGAHQLDNAAAAVAAAACLRRHGMRGIDMAAVAAGLAAAQLPGRFQLCQFSEDAEEAAEAAARAAQGASSSGCEVGPWVVLDGAHTPESAAALAHTLRELLPTAPVALVMAMAEDKQHREFCQAIRTVQPSVAVFTSVPIAGGAARAASPGQLAGAWQAAAILGGGRARGGVRTRELIQASVTAAVERARMELRSQRGQRGVVVVCGSLHAVGAALAQLPLEAC
ncbi:Dihydrofolate synthetase [Chlorella vulgaris]